MILSEFDSVLSFYSENNITLDKEWLKSCITWCKSELGANHTRKQLLFSVLQQWLLADLRDFNLPILPKDVNKQVKSTLPGTYFLQIMKIVDIAKPKAWQLQKIRDSNASLAKTWNEENEYGKRVLLLTLSDGQQEIEAMEYRPVMCLNVNLPPGCKMKLIGPVTVRRGRVLIEEKNVRLDGGNIEEILVTNAMENVLARALRLPENPNPKIVDEKMFEVARETQPTQVNRAVPRANVPRVQNDVRVQNKTRQEPPRVQNEVRRPSPPALEQNEDIFDWVNDDFFEDFLDDEELAEMSMRKAQEENTVANLRRAIEAQKTGKFKVHGKFVGVVEKLTFAEASYKLIIKIADKKGEELVVRLSSDVIEKIIGFSPSAIRELKTAVSGHDLNATKTIRNAIGNVKTELERLDNLLDVTLETGQMPIVTEIL